MNLYDNFAAIASGTIIGDCNDTNILNTIHLSENDHTNILWQLLTFRKDGEYPFMKSFFKKVLGLRYDNYFNVDAALQKGSGTQYHAIPNNGSGKGDNDAKGYIDLLIKGEDTVVIIENKVCGAGDSPNQLVRYYHSFAELTNSEETEEYYDKIKNAYDAYHKRHEEEYGREHVFVVYLTLDGKDANHDSVYNLSQQLGSNFIPASYVVSTDGHKSILDWLRDDVLPNIPYLSGGVLLQSVLMYVNYLEESMLVEDDAMPVECVNGYYKNLFRSVQVNTLIGELRENRKQQDREYTTQYDKCLKTFINSKMNELLQTATENNEWRIHWTTGYIMLFKTSWAKYGTFRYCNKVHWEILKSMDSAPDYFWSFHMEGDDLSKLAKDYEAEWQSLFGERKKVNGSGQFQKISDFGVKPSDKYLLDLTDVEIMHYLQELLSNPSFNELTQKAEGLLDKRFFQV